VTAIALWWIGDGPMEPRILDGVRADVERAFALPTGLATPAERPSGTLDPARQQHLSTGVLRWLLSVRPSGPGAVLAVTDADLFIPVLTFVFGEAKLGGGVAVVSTARLGGARIGPTLLGARLAKECIHELGHAFGLVHCGDARCVMARSPSIVHVDAKRGMLCRDCRIRLGEFQRKEGGA
jgi:archaemetzincin